MKSANQSFTDPFAKKLKRLCSQPFIFIAACCCTGSSWVYLVCFVLMKCC